jgi:hypothetical protein
VIVISALTFLLNHPSPFSGQVNAQAQNALNGLTLGAMIVSSPIYLWWVWLRRRDWWSSESQT